MNELSTTEFSDIDVKKHNDQDKNIIIAAKGGGITFAGRLFESFISLCFVIIVSRLLGAEQYGLYRLTLTIVLVTSAFCLLGLEGGLSRFIAIALKDGNKQRVRGTAQVGVGYPLLIGLLLFILIAVCSDQIATQIFNKPKIAPLLKLASFTIPMLILIRCLSSIAVGFKQVQYEVYSQAVVKNLTKLFLTVIAISLGFGVQGTITAYVIAVALSLVILFYFVWKLYPFSINPKAAQRNTREMFRYSFPFYLSRVLAQFGGQLETIMLGSFAMLADVGIYAIALQIAKFGKMGYESMGKISVPIFAELHSQGKYAELESYYQTVTKWGLTFTLPIFLMTLLFPDTLLSVFGEEFTAGSIALIILMAGILLDSTTGNIGILINVTGYTKVGFLNSVIYLIITLTLNFLLIPRWNLIGACFAFGIALTSINIIRIVEIYFLLNRVLPFNWTFLKPIGSAIVALLITFWLKTILLVNTQILQCVVLLIIMSFIYFAMLFVMKIEIEDRLIIDRILERLKLKKQK